MSSWSCPYLDEQNDTCRRLKTDCVPGRRGCVLPGNMRFAVSAEERVKRLAARRRNTGPDHAGDQQMD